MGAQNPLDRDLWRKQDFHQNFIVASQMATIRRKLLRTFLIKEGIKPDAIKRVMVALQAVKASPHNVGYEQREIKQECRDIKIVSTISRVSYMFEGVSQKYEITLAPQIAPINLGYVSKEIKHFMPMIVEECKYTRLNPARNKVLISVMAE
jgi:S-adenosylmethionine synthetase